MALGQVILRRGRGSSVPNFGSLQHLVAILSRPGIDIGAALGSLTGGAGAFLKVQIHHFTFS